MLVKITLKEDEQGLPVPKVPEEKQAEHKALYDAYCRKGMSYADAFIKASFDVTKSV